MRRRGRKVVRHEDCPRCGETVPITAAELRRRVAHCLCRAEVAIAIHPADAHGRVMEVVETRALLGPPPSPRLVEEFGRPPTLVIRRPATRPPDTLLQPPWPEPIDWILRLRFPTVRLSVTDGVLEMRGRWFGRVTAPVAALRVDNLPLDGLELRDDDRAWILAWINEHAGRR